VTPDGPARRQQIEDTTAARLAEIVAAAEQAAKGVIDEAEAEARERLADATEEADRIVAERLDRLAGLTEELDLQAEALKRGVEALREALAQARAELGGAEAFGGSGMGRDPAQARAVEPEPEAEPEPRPERRREPDPDPRRTAGPSLTIVGAADREPAMPPRREPTPRDGAPGRDPASASNGTPDHFAARSPEPDFEPASNGTPAGARLLATQMAVSGSTREEIEQRLRSGFAIADATSILDAILGPER
jgi:vacuolar-type H+-ATPase subunit H